MPKKAAPEPEVNTEAPAAEATPTPVETAAPTDVSEVITSAPTPPTQRFEKFLACKLTEPEITANGRRLAELNDNLRTVLSEKKQAVTGFKNREESITIDMAKLDNYIRTGTEYREVECETRFDLVKQTKVTVRLDTGEEIARCLMTAEEVEKYAQAPLPFGDDLAQKLADDVSKLPGIESATVTVG